MDELKIRDMVYLKTDSMKQKRIITKYMVTESGKEYCLALSDEISWHWGFEIEKCEDVNKAVGFSN